MSSSVTKTEHNKCRDINQIVAGRQVSHSPAPNCYPETKKRKKTLGRARARPLTFWGKE